jgi:hypothetical protein
LWSVQKGVFTWRRLWRLNTHGFFWSIVCFKKLLTLLHRVLKMLFIMKSIKTVFAISSIRYIKVLIHLVILTLNRFVLLKNTKTTHKILFSKCYNTKKKRKTFNFLGVYKEHEDLSKCMNRFLWLCSIWVFSAIWNGLSEVSIVWLHTWFSVLAVQMLL